MAPWCPYSLYSICGIHWWRDIINTLFFFKHSNRQSHQLSRNTTQVPPSETLSLDVSYTKWDREWNIVITINKGFDPKYLGWALVIGFGYFSHWLIAYIMFIWFKPATFKVVRMNAYQLCYKLDKECDNLNLNNANGLRWFVIF